MFFHVKNHIKTYLAKCHKAKIISKFSCQFNNAPQLYNPFFVVVMTGGLHVAHLSISLVPDDQDIVIIMNGLDSWEKQWLKNNLKVTWIIDTNYQLGHSEVLDALFDNVGQNFGVLDYDCFVLNEDYFRKIIELDDRTAMNCCFFRRNDQLNIDVPETFILFFNEKLVNQLRSEFKVGCGELWWKNIPVEVQEQLNTIGLDENHMPEFQKPYYDTLRILMMLSLAKQIPYRFVAKFPTSPAPSGELFHVGGISDPLSMKGIWAFRGSYFWQRLLEKISDKALKENYSEKFKLCSSEELLLRHPEWKQQIGDEFLKFCDNEILSRYN